MWSSRLRRRAALGIVLLAPLLLAGCTGFRPVYGDAGTIQQRLELSYSKPGSRLEQIIIQDLALRLGSGGGPDSPTVTIAASSGARSLTRTGVTKPKTEYEMTVTASFTVSAANGRTLVSGSRTARAAYSTVGQVLADEAAAKDAVERAGREVAETIRLSILARLVSPIDEATAAQ